MSSQEAFQRGVHPLLQLLLPGKEDAVLAVQSDQALRDRIDQLASKSPLKHGGTDEESNLGLACIDCNLHKGPNLTGIEPLTEEVTQLFHPRQQRWDDHFRWKGIFIHGLTPRWDGPPSACFA